MAIKPQRMSNVAWTIASHILMRNRCALDVSKFRWTKNQDVLIEKWIVERYDVALMVTDWTFQGQIYLYDYMIDFLSLLWSSCADRNVGFCPSSNRNILKSINISWWSRSPLLPVEHYNYFHIDTNWRIFSWIRCWWYFSDIDYKSIILVYVCLLDPCTVWWNKPASRIFQKNNFWKIFEFIQLCIFQFYYTN